MARSIVRTPFFRRLLFLPPVLVGIAVLVFFVKSGAGPERLPPVERVAPVRVITVVLVDVVPRALGYGYAEPGHVWEAVAEVGGRIVEKHPRLASGELIAGGEVILRIDPTDYLLAVERAEAQVRGVEAQIAELDVRQANTARSLEIELRGLELAESDLERKGKLRARGNISQSALDASERGVLSLLQAVQGQRSALDTIPVERQVLEATRALYRVELKQAQRDLERTEIVTPFHGRVAAVAIEERQYAAAGQKLVEIHGIELAEVAAQIPLDKFRRLVEMSGLTGEQLTADQDGSVFQSLGLSAVVRFRAGDLRVEWPARVARIRETLDPQTRTAGIVVAVDDPYRSAKAGERPPLTKNMYVEVELRGIPQPDKIVIPRTAVHDGAVYVVDGDSRLRRRPVGTGMSQSNFIVINEGLAVGDRVVVGDLVPAIEGMLLDPVEDTALRDSLASEAAGAGDAR